MLIQNSQKNVAAVTAIFCLVLSGCQMSIQNVSQNGAQSTQQNTQQGTQQAAQPTVTQAEVKTNSVGSKIYSLAELQAMAGNDVDSGLVPLGDYKYVLDGPKKRYIYLCHENKDNNNSGGSMVDGPWMHGDSWNLREKISVEGDVKWPTAKFSEEIVGAFRELTGNGLPISHNTGIFPVSRSTDAGKYDPNPNKISAQILSESLSADPVYSDAPFCMGGEVGVMLSGVPLFNGFDAGLRDAVAHELQDECQGHPQGKGQYHYHSLSSCFKDASVKTVLGYAYDGFPITGPVVNDGKYLSSDDLDECHGLTSEINLDGKSIVTYHYVMTLDFPYSASCFRARPIETGPGTRPPKR